MDAMWKTRGSAFKVLKEWWKTFEHDDEMVSEPGQRRIRDRELETARDIYELAAFVATKTFDAEIDTELVLNIDGHGERRFNVRDGRAEVSA